MENIDVDKVKKLLDSYWKKWEPYEQGTTKIYIDLAKEDFLYRIEQYNDFIKRKDLSHFYPFRTILERLLKYEVLLTFPPKKREEWLHWDMTEGWKKLSEESVDNGDVESNEVNSILTQLEEKLNIGYGTTKMDIKGVVGKSKIVHSEYTYDIYKAVCEYCHGSLLSAAMRLYGDDKYMNLEFSRIILEILEKLSVVEE
jgi:hypothetical protein